MSFVINSCEWDFNGKDAVTVSRMLEQLLERIDVANQRSEQVYIGAELQSQNVSGGMDLWTFLYDSTMADIDGSILSELAAVLNSIECYEDEHVKWPPNFPTEQVVDLEGNDVGLDLTFAHCCNIARIPMACITLSKKSTLQTTSKNGESKISFVSDEESHKAFWRYTALSMVRDTPENIQALCHNMYPNLHFFDGVWRGISDFQGGYARASYKLKKYLECLDDYGIWVFTAPPPAVHPTDTARSETGSSPSNELIEKRFAGLGIDMAPEKPNVRNDSRCYQARLINFQSTPKSKVSQLYCEWHGKLEPNTNRVHIHPPVLGISDKVIVAIYHKHLPLP